MAWLLAGIILGLVVGLAGGWFARGATAKARPGAVAGADLAVGVEPAAPSAVTAVTPATVEATPQPALTGDPPQPDSAEPAPEPILDAARAAPPDDLEEKSRRLVQEMERRFGQQAGPKRPDL
ncbi:MAG: hypothetical protein M3024_14110 [Candidatus Dormibacteraeota bacterium]|nr:hypothetical protein [Candidatus Dormibacteraeota bacterium]